MARTLTIVSTVLLAASAACADQILQVDADTLTTYLYASGTGLQGVRPLVGQRGVHVDGGVRAPDVKGWAMAGNPFGGMSPGSLRLGDVDLANGTYSPTEVDLALPAHVPWIVARSHNHAQVVSAAHHDSNGPMGYNWFYSGQPELAFFTGATDDKDVIYLVYGADRFLEFKRTGESDDTFRAMNGAAGVIEYEAGSPDVYVYYDQAGNRTYFFGDDTDSDKADWQLWKVVDPAGNTAYVGDPTTAATAVTNGYNSDKTVSKAYDSAGRRYCHTYATVGVSRLTRVLVETDGGNGWGACGEDVLVAQVDYEYYTSDGDDHGKAGDLKLVEVTMPLTDSGINLTKKRYYRYYDAGWTNSSGLRGEPHMIKMVVGEEGTRGQDWLDEDWNESFLTESDANLKPYAEAYLEYTSSSDYRVSTAFFSGECGCSGGVDGEYAVAYSTNGSYSDGGGYTTTWCKRVVVAQPDGIYFTQYFDETGQTLSRVVTDAAPSGAYTDMWATEVIRDSDGQVTEIRTPAANDTYTHSTGALAGKASDGLITLYARVSGGDTDGFLEFIQHKKGTSGTVYYDSKMEYTDRDLNIAGSVNVTRPMVSARRAYHAVDVEVGAIGTAANYHATSMSYAWWSGTSTDVLYITPKQATTTHPTVTTAQNGSNTPTTSDRFIRKDGTTAFTVAQDGITSYTRYNTLARADKSIQDCQTNHGSDFASGDDPNGDFGITETGNGVRRITEHSYDAQGRPETTTLADGRVTRTYYSRLADHRTVTISFPRRTTGGSTTHFGPAGYSVANQAGKSTFGGTIAITAAGLTNALTGYIDETDDDPITALDLGTLARMQTQQLDESGTKVESSRAYHDIPGSGTGSDGSNYDQTSYAYDDMGRQRRVLSTTGTISRTVFDDLGRAIEHWTGTNDNSNGALTGGSSNMVKVASTVYDSGADGGNSLVTMTTAFVENGTGNRRDTSYLHDLRGRTIVTLSPQAPYALAKYDNLGRMVAMGMYSSTSGLDAADNPTSLATNRVALSQTFYDERGMVYKTQRHEIDQSDGSDDDNLQSLTWYDAAGRTIKVHGEQLTKSAYDRLGRGTKTFTLASTDDTVYADADDLSGDIVLQERQTVYESASSDNVVMSVQIARHSDDLADGTAGALDSNADADDLAITAANIEGRVSITAMWHDALDRVTDTVAYGTNAILGDGSTSTGTFDRDALGIPARSDTALRTTYTYNDDGTVQQVTDPRGLITRTLYDDAGRRLAEIRNYINGTPSGVTGDDDVFTRWVYTDGLMTKMWVDLDGDDAVDADDQETLYIYGSTAGTPGTMVLTTGHLLRAVVYPDSSNGGTTLANIDSDSSDVVSYAYNAQGEVIAAKDQAGNIITTAFDTGGRETSRTVSTLIGGFDGAVRGIATVYDSRGMASTVTQYDDVAMGGGDLIDQVKYTYDNWGNLTKFEQDTNTAVGGASVDDYEVGYAYAKVASTGRNTIRRTGLTQRYASTDKLSLTYEYLSTGNSLDDAASRLSRVKVSTTVVALYKYLGDGTVVNTAYPDIDVFKPVNTSTTGVYRMDNFNRITDDRWVKDLDTDQQFVELDIAYDRNSNIVGVEDQIVGAGTGFDVEYTMDGLDRLSVAEEGSMSAGSVGSTTRQEQWTLSQTGNWELAQIDLDGDLNWNEANEFNDDRTHNVANELTARDTDDNGSDNFTLTYDANGNLTDDGEDYEYVYDAFGRLREVRKTTDQTLLAEYRYNALGFRIGWHYDTDADNDVDGSDLWYYFAYDEGWRLLATYRSTDTSPKEQFVYHNAGLGGYGGSSYIDAVILRNRDANTAWTTASDATLEEVRYYCQNFRGDVAAILTGGGRMAEWARYSSYGTPWGMPAGDTDSDGDWDASDDAAITGPYDVRKDAGLDGTVSADDVTRANAITGGYQTLGREFLTSTGVKNRIAYAGYQYDPTFAGLDRHLFHVRHRVYDAEAGRWTRRDPLGYVDSESLYEYGQSSGLNQLDPAGLKSLPCAENNCGAPQPTGLTYAECVSCKNEALRDPAMQALLLAFQGGCLGCSHGRKTPRFTCSSASDCDHWGNFFPNTCTIRLCFKHVPTCEELQATVFHEMMHAYWKCLGKTATSCTDAICDELNAYRYDGTCCRLANRQPGEDYHACLRRWVRASVGTRCTDAEFDAAYPNLLTSCFPQYLPVPGPGSHFQCEFPG